MKYVLAALAIPIVLIMLVIGAVIYANNSAATYEQGIIASHENGKNILAQYGQKVGEAVQIPKMQKDALIELTRAAMEGRYGDNGSQAMVQWIQENNIQLDQSTYRQLMQIIESGRDAFAASQTRLIDQKRSYATSLSKIPFGFLMTALGYPKIHFGYPNGTPDDYPVISTARANDIYEKGQEDGPIKLGE